MVTTSYTEIDRIPCIISVFEIEIMSGLTAITDCEGVIYEIQNDLIRAGGNTEFFITIS